MIYLIAGCQAEDQYLRLLADTSYGAKYTFVDDNVSGHTIRVVSSSEIIWLDGRFSSKPLLALKHGRRSDRTLRLQTMQLNKREGVKSMRIDLY